jgi:hypothetical protein
MTDSQMFGDMRDAIERFADGEAVDPERLLDALADDAGRALFVDLLVLRRLVRSPPSETIEDTPDSRAVWRSRSFARPWILAAALIMTATIAGYLGHSWVWRPAGGIRSTTTAAATSAAALTITAPTPTQILRVDPGVDWTEYIEGR